MIIVILDRAWSAEEDRRLAELVGRFGAGNWALSELVSRREWAGTSSPRGRAGMTVGGQEGVGRDLRGEVRENGCDP